jgi:hypothetical protein
MRDVAAATYPSATSESATLSKQAGHGPPGAPAYSLRGALGYRTRCTVQSEW